MPISDSASFVTSESSEHTSTLFLLNSAREFTSEWWTWLLLTGVFLACSLGSKMVGLFTFFTIGTAVVVDLWDVLDIKKGHTMVGYCFSWYYYCDR